MAISRIRTFKSDTSEYIKKKGVSMVDIVAAQVKRGFPDGLKDIKEKKAAIVKKALLVAVILLLVGGAVAAGVFLLKQKQEEQVVQTLPRPIILAEDELEIKPDELKDILLFPVGANKFLYFPIIKEDMGAKKLITAQDFFNEIEAAPPLGLINALEDKFMLAVFRRAQKEPILIFKVKSYEHGFVAMLKWERDMVDDFEKIFNLDAASARDFFKDKEIRNNDTRILNDTEENPILIYSFFNRKYLIITTGETALKETLRRLSSVQYLNE